MALLGEVLRHVDVFDPRFGVAVVAVLFNPFFWNVVCAHLTFPLRPDPRLETSGTGDVSTHGNAACSSPVGSVSQDLFLEVEKQAVLVLVLVQGFRD
ncbi:unnamed protein product [Merluccius merluccius]